MRRLNGAGVALAILGCAAAPPACAGDLATRLDAALAHPGCRGASLGVLVVRAADGAELFARGAERPLVPASNMKVLTALAALSTFGPAHQFTTTVAADGPIAADGSVGTLAVRGGGDPALTSEELWRLAGDLRRLGLRRVRGDLLLDDTYFDAQRWHPAWGDASARAYHAPIAALSANYGSFIVEVAPAAGGAPRVNLDPPVAFLQLVDRVRPGTDSEIAVDRRADGTRDRVTVSGTIGRDAAPVQVPRSVSDPVRYAGSVLRLQLAALGIAVDGGERVTATPPGYTELLAFRGRPLGQTVELLMKWSNNNIAEMLVKDLGAHAGGGPGSWAGGIAAAQAQLAALGVDQRGLVMLDGSGLSAANRVTPRTLVEALRAARNSFVVGPDFAAALPLAGRDGTLRKRAPDATDRARAKTGLLNGASTLSGYARLRDGTDVVFAILNNGADAGDAAAIAANDAFLEALVAAAP